MSNPFLASRSAAAAPASDSPSKALLSAVDGDAVRRAFHGATGATVTPRDYAALVGTIVADVRSAVEALLVGAGVPATTARRVGARVTADRITVKPSTKGTGATFGFYAGPAERTPGAYGSLTAGVTWSDTSGAAFRAVVTGTVA